MSHVPTHTHRQPESTIMGDDDELISAASAGDSSLVAKLLSKEVDLRSYSCRIAFLTAAKYGHLQVLRQLLAAGIHPDTESKKGDTALIYAVTWGHSDVVAILLTTAAFVNHANEEGNTAFHMAAKYKQYPEATMLWDAGADPLIENHDGQSPLFLLPEGNALSIKIRASIPDAPSNQPIFQPSRRTFARLRHSEDIENLSLDLRKRRKVEMPKQFSKTPCSSHDRQPDLVEGDEKPLRLRFMALVHEYGNKTDGVTVKQAISEIKHALICQMHRDGDDDNVKDSDVVYTVVKHTDPITGQLNTEAFVKAFRCLRHLYMSRQKPKEPKELRERFQSATQSEELLLTEVAKLLLRTLFDQSRGPGSCMESIVSFRRSAGEWDDCQVDELLKEHASRERLIDEDGFVAVGMKLFFISGC
ncbi:tankyrase-1 [Gracilaria domingensis]|nr:tankyrase-1 [Gracilaria domingensis]